MRLKYRVSIGIVFLLIILQSTSPVKAGADISGDIARELVCQCSCIMVLSNCTHVGCASREAMTALIEQRLEQGQSAQQVIEFFITKYGEQVLAEPPKQGFNLMVWVLPFAGLLTGCFMVYIVLKKWVKQGKIKETDTIAETEEVNNIYRLWLEKDLQEFEKGDFR